ncbi:hematopoietic lineage cell-specific protein [Manacus vitellinus]|uniref:hematopoietic lineage cell-specific protein n=1 Tax=Manacus vitellinus TaxID=328815 RepID=UPI00115DCB8A|nr:hematopoietic lineage cell-specific protein [Manacus vitellinus]
MWKAVVGHDVSVKVEPQGDDWDTDPDFVVSVWHGNCYTGGVKGSWPWALAAQRGQGSGLSTGNRQSPLWATSAPSPCLVSRTSYITPGYHPLCHSTVAACVAGTPGNPERAHDGSWHSAPSHTDLPCLCLTSIHQLRNKVSEEHEVIKKKEMETGPKASYGYGGKFGTERDRMDKSAVGFEYKGEVEKHSSQTDYSRGFGGRYGVERDKVDKAAVGFDYRSQAEKHDSQRDYSVGFGGKFGVQRDRQDKNALGWDHQEEVQPHASQTDYAKGFGGRYGVQKDRVDKSAAGFDEMAAPTSSYEKPRPLEAGASSSTSSLRWQFEHMAREEESRRQAEEERLRRQPRQCPAPRGQQEIPPRGKGHTGAAPAAVPAQVPRSAHGDQPVSPGEQEAKREDEEAPPTLPPRPADLGTELCKVPSQDQPIYSESLDVGGDYEELPEPSDYCDSTSGGADYEELPAPLGKPDAIYDLGEDGGEDYEVILPQEHSQSQPHLANTGGVCAGQGPGTCAVALYDYQGEGDDEISFDPADTITHIEMVDEGWWRGQCHGRVGLFPANYVKLLQ